MGEYTERMRAIGPHPAWQVTPLTDHHQRLAETEDSDLVSVPVSPPAAGSHTLTDHGGPYITAPKLVLLFAGTWWGNRASIEAFAKDIMQAGYLTPVLEDIGKTVSPSYLGSFDVPALPAGTYLDSHLQTILRGWLQNGNIPQPDGATIYAVMFPADIIAQFDGTPDKSCKQFCAFHNSMDDGHILYTIETWNGCRGCNQGDPFVGACMTLGHEVAETVSDPTGHGLYEDSTGMENSDLVAWIELVFGPWPTQGFWTNRDGNTIGVYQQAVPQPPPPPHAGVKVRAQRWSGSAGGWEVDEIDLPAPDPAGSWYIFTRTDLAGDEVQVGSFQAIGAAPEAEAPVVK